MPITSRWAGRQGELGKREASRMEAQPAPTAAETLGLRGQIGEHSHSSLPAPRGRLENSKSVTVCSLRQKPWQGEWGKREETCVQGRSPKPTAAETQDPRRQSGERCSARVGSVPALLRSLPEPSRSSAGASEAEASAQNGGRDILFYFIFSWSESKNCIDKNPPSPSLRNLGPRHARVLS